MAIFFHRRHLSVHSLSCGLFDRLPKEVIFEIFARLPLQEVGTLALTSEGLRLLVAEFIPTRRCLAKATLTFHPAFSLTGRSGAVKVSDRSESGANGGEGILQILKENAPKVNPFAVLCKRMTCLLNTRDRIRYAFKIFDQCLKCHQGKVTTVVSEDWKNTSYTIQFVIMLQAFMRGWDDTEFPHLLQAFDRMFSLNKKIAKFFGSNRREDACLASEMETRLLLRCLTWDFAGNDYNYRASWILSVMKQYVGDKPHQQAMVLLLLFGPACQDSLTHYDQPSGLTVTQKKVLTELNNHTDWDAFVYTSPIDFREGKEMFYTLAQAICSCLTASPQWKDEMVCDVIDHMFTLPEVWRRDNVAGFLLFCSEALILHYLQSMLVTGETEKICTAAQLIIDMVIVSHRFDNELSETRGIGKVFDTVCAYVDEDIRACFHEEIWRALTLEIERNSLDMENEDIFDILRSFGVHIMSKAFNNKCLDESDTRMAVEE